jgi:hypothetical protein
MKKIGRIASSVGCSHFVGSFRSVGLFAVGKKGDLRVSVGELFGVIVIFGAMAVLVCWIVRRS